MFGLLSIVCSLQHICDGMCLDAYALDEVRLDKLCVNAHLHLQDHYLILCSFPHFPSILFVKLFTCVHFQGIPVLCSEYLTKFLPVKKKR